MTRVVQHQGQTCRRRRRRRRLRLLEDLMGKDLPITWHPTHWHSLDPLP